MVLAAAGQTSPTADEALASLFESYWYPLYAYLRSHGNTPEHAQDLTQSFFARILEKRSLRQADPARGRFRSFLLTSLKNFVANERERERAEKRGAGVPLLPLEFQTAEGRFQREPPSGDTPEKIFDRQWAITLLTRTTSRLKAEVTRGGNELLFERLKAYLTGDLPQLSYAETGLALGMSEGAVKVAVHRLRRQFRVLLHDEIAQTVSSAKEVEDEIRHLWSAVGR